MENIGIIVYIAVIIIALLIFLLLILIECVSDNKPKKQKKEKRFKHAYRVHYHSNLIKDATIIYAYSESDAVKRFYKEVDIIHFFDISCVEPVPKWD